MLKINADGAFCNEQHACGWGFTVKNDLGETVLAGAGKLEFVHKALQFEAEAVLQGLQAASDLGMVNIQVETDGMNLVSALRGKNMTSHWLVLFSKK